MPRRKKPPYDETLEWRLPPILERARRWRAATARKLWDEFLSGAAEVLLPASPTPIVRRVFSTRCAWRALINVEQFPCEYASRHAAGDYGQVTHEDMLVNRKVTWVVGRHLLPSQQWLHMLSTPNGNTYLYMDLDIPLDPDWEFP